MTFANIVGHDRQKNLLRRALESRRLPHAYLFEGPEGVGKRLMALALTRAIFCHEKRGCGDCAACRKVDHHNHPDLHFIEADGGQIKIEQVRVLQKELSYRPLEAEKKVCIVDDADKFNPAAGNALLKTLEEPRDNTLIILLSSRPDMLLSTIRSRCQRLPFSRIERRRLLEVLCEQLELDETEAHILASLAGGSFRKALGKDREFFFRTRRELLKTLTGLTSGSVLPLLEFAEKLAQDKETLPDIIEIFQSFYRDLLLYRHGRPQDELVNIDLLNKIHRVSGAESTSSILGKLAALDTAGRQLNRNVNRQLAVEVLLMRLVA